MAFLRSTAFSTALTVAFAFMAAASAAAKDRVYGVEIAPGGDRYVILRDVGEQRAFAFYEADDPAAKPTAIGVGAVTVEDFEWSGDYILYRVKGVKGGIDTTEGLKTLTVSRWMSISRLTGEMKTLFGNEQGSDYYYFITSAGQLLSSLPQEDGQALFARSFVAITESGPSRLKKSDDQVEYTLQRAILKTGDIRRAASGNTETIDWVVDPSGAVIARIDQSEQSKKIEIFAPKDGGKQMIKVGEIPSAQAAAQEIEFLGRGVAEGTIQAAIKDASGLRLAEFSLQTGAFAGEVYRPPAGQITFIPYDPRAARARIVYYAEDRERAFHLEESDRAAQASLEKALPGASVSIGSKSVDGSRMIARANYSGGREEYYFFDRSAKRLELVAAN